MIYSTSQKYKPESKIYTDFEVTVDIRNKNRLEFWISDPDQQSSIFLGKEEIEKLVESLKKWLENEEG